MATVPKILGYTETYGHGLKPIVGTPVDQPQSVSSYLIDTLKSLDPRTRAGALSLAAAFIPGSFGGGKLTPIQEAMMSQLAGRGAIYAQGRWLRTSSPPGHVHITPEDIASNPGLKALTDRLGYTTGNPGQDLLFPQRLGKNAPAQDRIPSELGTEFTEPSASAISGRHPGTAEESYPSFPTLPQDEPLLNMLTNILRGKRSN